MVEAGWAGQPTSPNLLASGVWIVRSGPLRQTVATAAAADAPRGARPCRDGDLEPFRAFSGRGGGARGEASERADEALYALRQPPPFYNHHRHFYNHFHYSSSSSNDNSHHYCSPSTTATAASVIA